MELFHHSSPCYHTQFTPEKRLGSDDHFIVDDLLDFPTDHVQVEEEPDVVAVAATSTDSSTAIDSYNSSSPSGGTTLEGHRSFVDTQFCVPYDDLAEFEWLSNVVEEEEFSSEDLQKLELISGVKNASKKTVNNGASDSSTFNIDMMVPGKARTKRSRTASCNWVSGLPVGPISDSNGNPNIETLSSHKNSDGRRCVHCATDKTPQWRSGPLGPKTLCNACGVRYKSGRLVPEYRPAASPTFLLTKHSNSHRKVLELRRKNEVQDEQQFIMINDDYQRMGLDYRQLI